MASETIALVDKLVKAKIPKQTATDLVDYIDKNQNEKIDFKLNFILWAIGGLLALFLGLTSIMVYLHSDLKSDIKDLKSDMKEIRNIILQDRKK